VRPTRWSSTEGLIDDRLDDRAALPGGLSWWVRDQALLRERRAEIDGRRYGRVPDFLCIGAQKAGTTWLADALRAHPEVFVPEDKELHYFDRHLNAPLGEYLARLDRAETSIVGEVTPAYALLPSRRVRLVHRLNPALRIVMILRNPAERAWSQTRMEVLVRSGRSIDEVGVDELIGHLASRPNTARSGYAATIARWRRIFGESSLLVCSYADLVDRPGDLIRRVLRHIGADPDRGSAPTPGDVVHQGLAASPPPEVVEFLRDRYQGAADVLEHRFGVDLSPRAPWWESPGDDVAES